MKNWGFDELSEAVRESYGNFIRGGLNPGQAVERCLYEFESTMDEGDLEKVVVMATIGVVQSESIALSRKLIHQIFTSLDSYETLKSFLALEPEEMARLGKIGT